MPNKKQSTDDEIGKVVLAVFYILRDANAKEKAKKANAQIKTTPGPMAHNTQASLDS